MRKIWVVLLVVGLARAARADVDAEGNILPTGNVSVDAAIVAANAWNRMLRDTQDANQVLAQKGKLLEKIGERRKELVGLHATLKDGRDKLADEEHKLDMAEKKGGGKDQELADRRQELVKARKGLESAEAELKGIDGYAGEMEATLGRVSDNPQQALADWKGGLQRQFVQERAKLETKVKSFREKFAGATAILAKVSGAADNQIEEVGDFQVTVREVGGKKLELWINGKKAKIGEPVGVGKDRKIWLRAVLVDARRKQSADFDQKKPEHVEVVMNNPYELAYGIPGGKQSHWKVTAEKYEWDKPEAGTGAALSPTWRSSGGGGRGIPVDDVLEMTIVPSTAVETIRTHVKGEITWMNGSEKNEDSDQGSIEIKVTPAH